MPEPIAVRPAIAADVDAVVELVTSAYRGESSTAGWTTEHDLIDGGRTTPELVAAAANGAASAVLVAELDAGDEPAHQRGGDLQATLIGCIEVSHDGVTARFGMLAVSPTLQSAGLGTLLITSAEHWARDQWHCETMELGVIEQRSELIEFYERRGYRATGATIPFPYGDERYGRPKRDDLRLQVMHRSLI